MDKLRELLERIPWSVLLGVYLAYMAYTNVYRFYYSDDSELKIKQKQVETLDTEIKVLEDKYKKAKEFEKNLEQKRAEIRALATQLDEMKATLSETLDVPAFVKMIVTEAAKVGLSVVGIKPTSSKQQQFYMEQSFELEFKAVYVQLLVFLERLASVERIVRIESLDARPSAANTAQYIELSGKMELKTYKYVGSEADQVGKVGTEPASVSGAAGAVGAPGAAGAAKSPAAGGVK